MAAPGRTRACYERFLSYDYPETVRQRLERVAASPYAAQAADDFGAGALYDVLESRVAGLLGKPAAVFMPTGRLAQLCAVKAWSERRQFGRIALHPQCHLEYHEARAYHWVLGLDGVPFGALHRQVCPADLDSLPQDLAAVLVELPLLASSCRLPPWEDLAAISGRLRQAGIPLHCDGARLWECAPFYSRPVAEIAALFDTVYVSAYKALGAMAGAVLAGPADLVAQARLWRGRMGGAPPRLFPLLIDALDALDCRLERIPAYVAKARTVAAAFSGMAGVHVTPDPPHTDTFTVTVAGTAERLRRANAAVADVTGLWMVDVIHGIGVDGLVQFQVVAGEATLDVEEEMAVRALHALIGEMQA